MENLVTSWLTVIAIIITIITTITITVMIIRYVFRIDAIVHLLEQIRDNTNKGQLTKSKRVLPARIISPISKPVICQACKKPFPPDKLQPVNIAGEIKQVCPSCKKFLKRKI